MSIDLGEKNIGIAVSDESCVLAQGREVIQRSSIGQTIKKIKEIAEEFDVKEIVVGLPLNLDGSVGKRAEDSIKFVDKLKLETDLSVKLWDERFSTKEAESVMIKASVRRNKRKKIIDKMAAQIILQGYLDSLTSS